MRTLYALYKRQINGIHTGDYCTQSNTKHQAKPKYNKQCIHVSQYIPLRSSSYYYETLRHCYIPHLPNCVCYCSSLNQPK